jgi:nicotinamidase-related amidase
MVKRSSKFRLILVILVSMAIGLFAGFLLPYYPGTAKFLRNIYNSLPVIQVAETGERMVTLNIRTFRTAGGPDVYDTERDSTYIYETRKLDLNRTALVLIDVWQDNLNEGWMERAKKNMESKIAPLLELARKYHITLIHVPNNGQIAELAKPLPDEFVVDSHNLIDDTVELDRYLKAHNIKTLIYAGYASNECVLYRATGIIKMKELGYSIILLHDSTIAVETPESLDGEWANRMAINTVEREFGVTAILEDLKAALEQVD